MLRFTIAKKINTFTIILVLTCILASSFSIIASIKGINEAETLDEVSLSANLLLTAVKTNVLNVNSDVSKYVITGDQKYIKNTLLIISINIIFHTISSSVLYSLSSCE